MTAKHFCGVSHTPTPPGFLKLKPLSLDGEGFGERGLF